MAEKEAGRPLELEDLLKLEYLSAPAADAERARAWYVVSRAVPETGGFASEVWEAALDGSGAAPVLPGAGFSQKLPRPGADGALYLLSDEAEPDVFQVWRLDSDGTRAQLTHLRHGVRWFSLTPRASALAFEARLWPEELGSGLEFQELKGPARTAWKRAQARKPVEVTELMYKLDSEYGLLDGSVAQVGVVELVTGEERLLTRGATPHEKPVVSPDGTRLACWSRPYDGWRALSGELAVIDIASGAEALITKRDPSAPDEAETGDPMPAQALTDEPPLWLSARELAYCAYTADAGGALQGSVMSVGAVPGAAPSELPLSREDCCFGPGAMATSHTAYGYAGEALKEGADGTLLLLSAARSVAGVWPVGGTQVAGAPAPGGRLTPDKVCVQGFAPAGAETLVLIMGTPAHPAEPYALNLATGALIPLAHHNAWLDEVAFPVPEERVITSPAADAAPVHGWVLRPLGLAPGATVPVVLDIHGGPECFTPFDWWFEFQYLAARGFCVVWCDPHGSISHGGPYQKGAWDDTARDDLLAFLDAACAEGFIDPARAGVTGGSYGGYMTNVMIGTTERFAAAVSQRNLCNRAISYGTGDMGALGTGPGQPALRGLTDRLKSGSTTIKDVDRITAPTLVLHATADYRCGFEQADQLYHALKDRRPELPSRLAAFPGENHGLTREGNAWAQVGHLREMTAWFERFLKPGSEAAAGLESDAASASTAPAAAPHAAAGEGDE